jgi:hypothetical protein
MSASRKRDALDEMSRVVTELGHVLTRERNAIANLDLELLKSAEADKERLAGAIHAILAAGLPTDPARRDELLSQVRRVRNDLHANALLVTAAAEAVRAALGFEEVSGYDRLARRAAPTRPMRVLTAL